MSPFKRLFGALALGLSGLLMWPQAAWCIHPQRPPSWREAKADFHDKELALTYALGPGSLDFAFLPRLSLGVGTDNVFGPRSWAYRGTWTLVDNPDAGLAIALNGGVTQIRALLAGNVEAPTAWGWQGGFLVTLLTQSGLTFRGGFQLYDTNWSESDGQAFLFSPEIAYRLGIAELTLAPGWPLDLANWSWVGVRLRF